MLGNPSRSSRQWREGSLHRVPPSFWTSRLLLERHTGGDALARRRGEREPSRSASHRGTLQRAGAGSTLERRKKSPQMPSRSASARLARDACVLRGLAIGEGARETRALRQLGRGVTAGCARLCTQSRPAREQRRRSSNRLSKSRDGKAVIARATRASCHLGPGEDDERLASLSAAPIARICTPASVSALQGQSSAEQRPWTVGAKMLTGSLARQGLSGSPQQLAALSRPIGALIRIVEAVSLPLWCTRAAARSTGPARSPRSERRQGRWWRWAPRLASTAQARL